MTGEVLWRPSGARTRLDEFADAVREHGGPGFDSYEEMWRWSVDDLESFWSAVWTFFDVPSDGDPSPALATDAMPGADWFPGVRLNYAEAMLRMPERDDDDVVVIARSQSRDEVRVTAAELRDQVARARAGLVRFGVGPGDRVAAYAPNIPETLVLMLATASLGAVFSSCAPEFGVQSVIDRWQQIEPKLLLAVDGYRYGDKAIDRRAEVEAIRARLQSVHTVVWLPYLDEHAIYVDGAKTWADLLSEPASLEFERVPFDAPLYVLFSSGTTGLPKPIVHGHGGITVEHLKVLGLQSDLGPADRFFWFSTTGWMMWNYLASGIGVGATIVLLDGNPAHPDLSMLWHLADELELTYFGTSAPFLLQCRKEELVPRDIADLSAPARARLHRCAAAGRRIPVGLRGASATHCQLASVSGGTDVCSAFVGAAPSVPVYAGEISCRSLGCAVEAFDETGRSVVDELGELVITRPMPSMPVGFWGDDDGSRYREAYFDDFPGVWRHGDWITITDRGTCMVTGRSDATLNRGGVRLGTSEFYSVVESLPGVADSLVVHLEDDEGGAGTLMLFVVLAEGQDLDDDLRASDREGAAHAALAPARPRRGARRSRAPAHALGQEARGAGQEDPARRVRRGRRRQGRPHRPGLPRRLRRAPPLSGQASRSSAIWMVLRAAPLRRLSPLTNSTRPVPSSSEWSWRMRPTRLGSVPAACSGVGTSTRRTPGADARISVARSGVMGRLNWAWIDSEWPVNTGTRTHVPATLRSGMPRILRVSLRSFCSSSVSFHPSSTMVPASGRTLNAMGATYLTGAGKSTADPSWVRASALSTTARDWECSSSTPATPEPDTDW